MSEASYLAWRFHTLYEQLAPEHGYETRRESSVAFSRIPEANRNLMIATCQALIDERTVLVSSDDDQGEGDRLDDRSPTVKIEVQLRPSPPWEAHPYWWGNRILTFHDDFHGHVFWEADVGALLPALSCDVPLRVARRRHFGWVLVIELWHDKARTALESLMLPDAIRGDNTGRSRWSYWGDARQQDDGDGQSPTRLADGPSSVPADSIGPE